ncbi:unnamed protein product [Hermetia illucens]|uniref:Uncharacterized protein n=2 Tax=Hermetia illucens TaxID=343691 RepID=A0A7R8UU60_HERIL|nr:unnamed protein product [Hermetia illucens]
MIRPVILLSLCTIALAGIIEHDYSGGHEEYGHAEIQDTDVHHEIDHKHATSHQSFKLHHFHPVPVYVKKEDQHLLKNPIELGGVKHKLKVLHPETELNHNHGLVLENHSEVKGHEYEGGHYEHYHHE